MENSFGILDPSTGKVTIRSGFGTRGPFITGLARDPATDITYGIELSTGLLMRFAPQTSGFEVLGGTGTLGCRNLAFDTKRKRLVCVATNAFAGDFILQLLSIDPTTLEVSILGTLPDSGIASNLFSALTYDPVSDRLFGFNSEDLWIIHPVTAAVQLVGSTGMTDCRSLEWDTVSNTLFATCDGSLLRIDPLTAAATLVGDLEGLQTRAEALVYDPDSDTLMGVEDQRGRVFLLNQFSGAATIVGRYGFRFLEGVEFDPDTGRIFGLVESTGDLITIDGKTGRGTLVGEPGVVGISGMAFDPALGLLRVADDGAGLLLEIDPSNATSNAGVALGESDIGGLAFDPITNTLLGVDAETDSLVALDPKTGSIDTIAALGLEGPDALAFDFQTGSLFVYDDESEALFQVDPSSGATTLISDDTKDMYSLAFEANTGRLLAAKVGLERVHPITGEPTSVGELGRPVTFGLALDAGEGVLYGVSFDGFFRVDAASGESTTISREFNGIHGLAFDEATDTLFGSNLAGDELVRIDTVTGEISSVGALGFDFVEGLAFDPVERVLYGTDVVSDQLIRINTDTGAGTAVGALGFEFVEALEYDVQTKTLYGCDSATGQFLAIDTETGAATAIGPTGFVVRGLAGRVP
jgi:uncharacterized protein YjiK